MVPERILILGSGYLATVLSKHYSEAGHTVHIQASEELDITDKPTLQSLIEREKPDRVFNTIAYTATAAAELPENRALAFKLNVQLPCMLLETLTVPWLHFSTGMMFDGTRKDGTGWQETDTAEPTGFYCWTKNWADGALNPFLESHQLIVARIHLPISSTSHPRNFLDRLLTFSNVIEEPCSLTIVDDMIPVIEKLFEKKAYGLYNIVNDGVISAAEIAEAAQTAGLISQQKEIDTLSRADLELKGGAKQTFPVLSTAKLASLGIALPNVRDSLERVLVLRK